MEYTFHDFKRGTGYVCRCMIYEQEKGKRQKT